MSNPSISSLIAKSFRDGTSAGGIEKSKLVSHVRGDRFEPNETKCCFLDFLFYPSLWKPILTCCTYYIVLFVFLIGFYSDPEKWATIRRRLKVNYTYYFVSQYFSTTEVKEVHNKRQCGIFHITCVIKVA